MKYDLRDVTFTIPIKIDSKTRARNLFIVYNYITRFFDTNIIICEQGGNYVPSILNKNGYEYINIKEEKNIIHRTHQLNIMAKHSNTPIISNYDCDVILKYIQYIDAVNLLREGKADIVYPYDGRFLEMPEGDVLNFVSHYDTSKIDTSKLLHVGPPNKLSVGGVIFYIKDKFFEYGMENENFCGWGFEDDERFDRFTKLNARIMRTELPLLHLSHPKNLYKLTHNNNFNEYQRIKLLNSNELKKEIQTWEWARA